MCEHPLEPQYQSLKWVAVPRGGQINAMMRTARGVSQRGTPKLGHARAARSVRPRDFPGAPVAKTLCSQCRVLGFDFWLGRRPV